MKNKFDYPIFQHRRKRSCDAKPHNKMADSAQNGELGKWDNLWYNRQPTLQLTRL
jgi:hypothetical protein